MIIANKPRNFDNCRKPRKLYKANLTETWSLEKCMIRDVRDT
jgi:hypothetical protein